MGFIRAIRGNGLQHHKGLRSKDHPAFIYFRPPDAEQTSHSRGGAGKPAPAEFLAVSDGDAVGDCLPSVRQPRQCSAPHGQADCSLGGD